MWTRFSVVGAGDGTVDTSGTPVDDDWARFTDADTIEGLSDSELLTALTLGSADSPQFTGIELSHAAENTLTASSGVLSIEGGALAPAASPTLTGTTGTATLTVSTQFKLPSSDADPTSTAGYLRHDSTVSNFTNGGLTYYNGAAIKQLVDMTTATASACTDDQVVAYDAGADLWYCNDDADTTSPTNITPVDTGDEDATFYPVLVDGATGTQATETDGEFTYNPSTGLLTVSSVTTAAWATPSITFEDSNASADDGTANILGTTSAGTEAVTMTLQVDEDDESAHTYIELDGPDEEVHITTRLNVGERFLTSGQTGGSSLNIANNNTTCNQSYAVGDSDYTFNLPADGLCYGETGNSKKFCFYSTGTGDITIDPDDADYLIFAGLIAAQGEFITTGGLGAWVCFCGQDNAYWRSCGGGPTSEWAQDTPPP